MAAERGYRIISIVSARSGVGKTSFISELVKRLSIAGLNVAVVKHIHHGYPDINESKDTERMYLSGARVAVAYGKETSLILVREAKLERILEAIDVMVDSPIDVVLAEGFRGQVKGEKVFILSSISDIDECLRIADEEGLIAVIVMSGDVEPRSIEDRGCKPAYRLEDGLRLVYDIVVGSASSSKY